MMRHLITHVTQSPYCDTFEQMACIVGKDFIKFHHMPCYVMRPFNKMEDDDKVTNIYLTLAVLLIKTMKYILFSPL